MAISQFPISAVFKATNKTGVAIAQMSGDIGRFMKKSTMQMRKFNAMTKGLRQGLGSGIVRSARMARTSLLGVGAALTGMFTIGARFDQAVVNVAAKIGDIADKDVNKTVRDLKELFQTLGSTTQFTALDAAGAGLALAQTGFKTQDIKQMLPKLLKGAVVFQMGLQESADFVTNALGAFGGPHLDTAAKKMEFMVKLMNEMHATTANSKQNFEDLNETLKSGATVMTQMGQSSASVMAMSGVLADANIRGTVAGTTLKNIGLGLQGQTPQAKRLLKKLKIEAFDKETGKMKSFIPLLQDMKRAFESKGIPLDEQITGLKDIFTKVSIGGLLQIMKNIDKRVPELTKAIEKATGDKLVERTAFFQERTFLVTFKTFVSRLQDVAIRSFFKSEKDISQIFNGIIRLVDKIAPEFVNFVGEMVKNLNENGKTIFATIKTVINAIRPTLHKMGVLLDRLLNITAFAAGARAAGGTFANTASAVFNPVQAALDLLRKGSGAFIPESLQSTHTINIQTPDGVKATVQPGAPSLEGTSTSQEFQLTDPRLRAARGQR